MINIALEVQGTFTTTDMKTLKKRKTSLFKVR